MWFYGVSTISLEVMLVQSFTHWQCVCAHKSLCEEARREWQKATTMTTPHNDMIGQVIDIVGIAVGDRGRSCEEHVAFCGVVLAPDVLVRLIKEEILVEGKIETVVSAYWVTDSVERCRVGFLPRFLVAKNADKVNGLLAQVTEVFDTHHPSAAIRQKVHRNFGFCHATILDPARPLNIN